jgi:hypothetical protein
VHSPALPFEIAVDVAGIVADPGPAALIVLKGHRLVKPPTLVKSFTR